MKKVISWMLFIFMIVIFVFDIYFAIDGMIEVKAQLDRLAASGASGHEYLGVGFDVLIIGIFLISLVGLIFALFSSKIAQAPVMRTISVALSCVFGLGLFSCFFAFFL